MAISNMQQPRQMYGLGSFVKKAFRGVKKIAKSPLGKMAIIGGLGMIPFGASKASMFSRLGGALSGGSALHPFSANTGAKTGMFSNLLGKFNGLSTGKKIFAGLGATAIASPFISKMFTPKVEEEEGDDDYITPYTAMMMSRYQDPYMNFFTT